MKIYLYTNFTFGAGFQYADLTPKGISQSTIPPVVKADFTNGGCRMVLKSMPSEKLSYLMIKDIVYVNAKKRIDEQGRKVFINFAIGADDSDFSRLRNIFKGFLANYSNAFLYLGTLYSIPAENALNYDVNYDKFMAFLNYLESSSDKITSKNGETSSFLNSKICNCIEKLSPSDSLVVLKGNDESYYTRLNADLLKSRTIQYGKYHFIKEDEIKPLVSKTLVPEEYEDFCCLLCGKTTAQQSSSDVNTSISVDLQGKKEEDTEAKTQQNIEEKLKQNAEPDLGEELEQNVESDSEDNRLADLMDGHLYDAGNKMNKLRFWGYLTASFVAGVLIGVAIGKIMSSN